MEVTVPQSYKIRFVPRDSVGTDDLAAEMARKNPNYTEDYAETMIATLLRVIQNTLLSGIQVTIDGALSFGISFNSSFVLAPDIPAQDALWQNECAVSAATGGCAP